MQKQAPTLGRLLTIVLFTLSCFGLALFLWLSFGGVVPLKSQGYRVKVAFPEAAQLADQADVREAGVNVGKVVGKQLDKSSDRTLVTLEIDPKFAPMRSNARAILRQKTLLGETYIALTPGTNAAEPVPEGGRLPDGRVQHVVQLDEILRALDPRTRRAFQTWQQDMGQAIHGRGGDVNDALGNLPGFAASATDLTTLLDTQGTALSRLIRNTGTVFGAISRDTTALRNLVTGTEATFHATAARNQALADTFEVFPTFLDESKATLARLETFAKNTDPLVRELRPAVQDLRPALIDTRALAPDLKHVFLELKPLIRASKQGLPALQQFLEGLRPLLGEVGPFLGELNPILQWLEQNQHEVADFISLGATALADTTATSTPGGRGHYLRQFGPIGPEMVAMYPVRPPSNRGNAYPNMLALGGAPDVAQKSRDNLFPFPSFDCNNTSTGGPVGPNPAATQPACYLRDQPPFLGQDLHFPHVRSTYEDYKTGGGESGSGSASSGTSTTAGN